jgi:hypothetical protein
MSDIPDWLVELAAQREEDDGEDEGMPEWDFLRADVDAPSESVEEVEELASGATGSELPAESVAVAPVPAEDLDEDTLIHSLRSQVEEEEVEAARVVPSPERRSFRIPGLAPWQQLVLAVLLLLDVLVIGLLFLVMFGRLSFG